MIILNISSIFWNIQKFFNFFKIYFFIRRQIFSTRRTNIKSFILNTSNESLPKSDYKLTLDSNFRRILRLENITINPKTGVMWKKNMLVRESSVWDTYSLLKWEPLPLFPKDIDENVLSLPDNGFFHFLIEDLPRFLDAYDFGLGLKVIAGSQQGYVLDVIRMLSLNSVIYPKYPLRVKSIVFSEKSPEMLYSAKDHATLKKFGENFSKPCKKLKIFIKREDLKSTKANSRGLNYQANVENKLKSLGFKIVVLEKFHFDNQIEQISQADTLVSFHGAGLANMIWMKPNSKVIELVSERFTRHFEFISEIGGYEYQQVNVKKFINEAEKYLH